VTAQTIGNNRGIALLVTLAVITILMVTTLEMNRRMRSSVFSAAADRDRITLLQIASAGVHVAQAILVKDKNDSDADSLQEDWADPEKIKDVLQAIPFEDGNIQLTISDELSKIQVNSLVQFPEGLSFNDSQKLMWERFLDLLIAQDSSLEAVDASTIIDALKDWLDSGDDDAITGLNGAESDYYKDLDPPYACTNGPFTHIDELKLVKGITPALFTGTMETPGIQSYATVYGMDRNDVSIQFAGRININTAELPVLAAILPLGSEGLAQAMYEFRQEKSEAVYVHDLSSVDWYKNVPGMGGVKIDPHLITTHSDLFRIESIALLHDMKLTLTAVVHREKSKKTGKWVCQALLWQAE
jgi:general secretion pathway protein K